MQLDIDGDFMYFLADAAGTVVNITSFLVLSLSLHFVKLVVIIRLIICSFNLEFQISYAPLLFKQRQMKRIWWYVPLHTFPFGSLIEIILVHCALYVITELCSIISPRLLSLSYGQHVYPALSK